MIQVAIPVYLESFVVKFLKRLTMLQSKKRKRKKVTKAFV